MYVPEDWNTPARLSKTTEDDSVVKAAMNILDEVKVYSVTYYKNKERYRIMFARSSKWNPYYIKHLIDKFAKEVKKLGKVVSIPDYRIDGYSNYYRVDVMPLNEPFKHLVAGTYHDFDDETAAWNFALKHCATDYELHPSKAKQYCGWYYDLIVKK